jgi:hypothetical protein
MAKSSASSIDPRDPRIMSGEIWAELCKVLEQTERLVLARDVPDSPLMRAEGLRYLTRLLAGGIRLCMELADPDYPEFGRMVDTTLSWGIDNPDCIYLYAAIRGDASYRISGNRGSAHHFDIQVNRGHFAQAPDFGVVSTLNGPELQMQPDGSVELILSPETHERNWLRLEPDAEWVLVRQYFNDWETERPADLCIERVGAEYPPPSLRTDQIAARFERLMTWLGTGANYWDEMARFSLQREPNSIYFRPLEETGWGGLRGLAYGFGNFHCPPGKAIILEVTPPKCHYWSFSLGNWYWESLDWSRRQTSLNTHQAVLDSDGVFRAVIAAEDPGVPNWLDPAGHTQGTIMGRYLLTDAAPEPVLRVVDHAELRSVLPDGTPQVSPADRSEQLRRRRHAVSQRNRH